MEQTVYNPHKGRLETINKERLEKRLGRISRDSLNEVDRAIKLSLALS